MMVKHYQAIGTGVPAVMSQRDDFLKACKAESIKNKLFSTGKLDIENTLMTIITPQHQMCSYMLADI